MIRWFGHYEDWELVHDGHNLLTNAGRDFFHAQVYTNTAAGTRGAGFSALSEDVGAPAAGDTTLAAEITIGGLARADATTKSHTAGTNTTLIEHTFTASVAFTAVQKGAEFNAASAGTMTHEYTFTSTALAINDQLKISTTHTLG